MLAHGEQTRLTGDFRVGAVVAIPVVLVSADVVASTNAPVVLDVGGPVDCELRFV